MNILQERAGTVLDGIEAHAFSDTRTEVGGILVGTLDDGGARILAALPALKAVSGQTNVTFTHEVWDEVLPVIDRDYPGQHIVGWYHTHPGFGLFLSEYDMFIHRNFFTDHRMLALVVDPLAGELGWFGWDGDEVILQERHPTSRPALQPVGAGDTPSGAATTRQRRPAALVGVPAIVLLGAIGGYLLGTHNADLTTAAQTRQIAVAASQTQTAQAETDQLRQQLAAAKTATPASPTPAAATPARATTNVQYRVQPGDTLWRVAQAFYGDGNAYPRIVKANPHLQPQALRGGQVLTVPVPDTRTTKKVTNGG
jgi:proteasome lid subunit RPN8/RPN11/LysM repeat protein